MSVEELAELRTLLLPLYSESEADDVIAAVVAAPSLRGRVAELRTALSRIEALGEYDNDATIIAGAALEGDDDASC